MAISRQSANRLVINLDNIAHNLAALRRCLPPGSRVAGVVKADAYGHGLLPVARTLKEQGAEALAVASLEEAAALRQGGVEGPILVLLGLWPGQAERALELAVTPILTSREAVEELAAAGRAAGKRASCQVKVDTGMGRLGIQPRQCLEFMDWAAGREGLEVTGLVSHLATAGEAGDDHCRRQARIYLELLRACRERGHQLPDSSLAGSGGTLVPPPGLENVPLLARLGIALYGGLPSPGSAGRADLRDAMSLCSRLLAVRFAPAGTLVSYGGTYQVPRDTWLGVVPVGYSEGYPRTLSNRGVMLVGGRRVPVRGRVCMNLTMVDLGQLESRPRPGDEVVLLGRQGGEEISLEELARRAGTISYEIACCLGAANPRRYQPPLTA